MDKNSILIVRRKESHISGNWINYCKDFNLNPRGIFIMSRATYGLCIVMHHQGTILKDQRGRADTWIPELFEVIQEVV